jgi:hypothetical protein
MSENSVTIIVNRLLFRLPGFLGFCRRSSHEATCHLDWPDLLGSCHYSS